MEEKSGESLGTVLVAGAANLTIALAKLVAGLIGGSAAMLSESAHSAADTVTELLLLVSVRRAGKAPDRRHPFGYGKAGFFWAMMAAVATLVGGAGFSITHGVHEISHGEKLANLTPSYIVLAVSFVIEGLSFMKALSQLRGEAGRYKVRPVRLVRITSDTALKAVLFEDAAALVGLLIAAAGLLGSQLTGSALWDGGASVAIGLLLLVVALILIGSNLSLLIGQAAPRQIETGIRAVLLAQPEVEDVVELLTMMIGPGSIMVAAKIDFHDEASAAGVEIACDEVDRRLRERFPGVSLVFLDPTPTRRR
ncbi:MAG: cation diffusion facilitator family transporter [Nonomuraea sp.]|nr:cation diffusion facilitator family transporter [Nonomuraea sp.]NUP69116.1 cation diffusion facilitator family transporter [Nonomuraea sp.]NUP79079.1 cation diffusion facilitator family transporter [Nonomuraea sp.]NUS09174.1 cation diffusion facilitator family transporter [Nonomuraea sp.]NUT42565.1 cation diffusion facilitator family transporter [Thermoactinospora sp.]